MVREKLPSRAQILVGSGALIGGLWLRAKSAEIEQAERQWKVQNYIKQAEQDVSDLIALENSEAVAILRDSIPRMDTEYWRFYEAAHLLSLQIIRYGINTLEHMNYVKGAPSFSIASAAFGRGFAGGADL